MDARPLAATALTQVLSNGRSWATVKTNLPPTPAGTRAKYLSLNVLRYAGSLRYLATTLLDSPLPKAHYAVYSLLLVALFELRHTHQPDYAVVHAAVTACRALNAPWAKGLVNAVLRRYLRERVRLDAGITTNEVATWEHPPWFISALKKAYPEQWQTVLRANNQQAPMDCRINLHHHDRQSYLTRLQQNGMPAQAIAHTQAGVRLAAPCAVDALPGFQEGDVSIQDAAGIQACEHLEIAPQQRLLDACCAPGGKAMALLEREPSLRITGIEKEAQRAQHITNNSARLKQALRTLHIADAADVASWWDGTPFDVVLLDAPCSASGVIRRHPDIKWLRKPHDIATLHTTQYQLLKALWPCLKPDGLFYYTTCSVLPDENHHVIARFLKHQPDAEPYPLTLPQTLDTGIGRQWLPCHEHDGFFISGLQKKPG